MSSPEEFFLADLADLSSAFVLLSGASGVSMSVIVALVATQQCYACALC